MQAFKIQQHLLKKVSYPSRYQSKELLKTVAVQFVLIFTFLLLFKPFGVTESEHKASYVFICGIHALSPALIIYIYFFCLSLVYENTSIPKSWTLLREYAHLAVAFLLTGVASFLLRGLLYTNPDNWSWHYLIEEVRNCYLAGVLFYLILLFANSHFQSNKQATLPEELIPEDDRNNNLSVTSTELFIKTQVQQDDFCFNPAQLLFVRADGNYIELTFCIDNRLVTELKRISLKQFEAQLSTCPFLFRCHRAYMVNLSQVRKVSGNAQGYTLSLHMTDEKVPVSRTQIELFNECYKQLTYANCM